ncbi:homoserine dehydrogenase [Oxobacter pfennigii]|uniref:Homoserine dehydrogenase n=1 Tax=Oxobacter pfennigii TaxID=36849 RepID=A0A0P8YVU7_9CLOT|nr:homoserine dehydrogenase [Oxobacter pfennigii]KPU43831.1 homoserine dehydrogenase [Oxobacter pfennigii]
MNNVKIAILGLGNIGQGVWKILNTNSEEILKRSGYKIEVAKILVRDKNKARAVDVPEGLITTNPDDIFNDDSIRIVVELMGGVHPAKDYMIKAIRNKKHVVTANKLAIATEGEEIFKAADEEGVMLYYEASVAGGIPVIHGINESLTANKIQQVMGIINGTTNYILTKMAHEGMDFDSALYEAQQKGYAEADPTSDVDGYDAVYKLAILANLAFGTRVDVNSIYREGIRNIKQVDIQYAKEFGYTIKLLAIVKEIDGALELRVHPTMIPSRHPLANVNDSFNAIFIKGNAVGDLMLYGRGAGDLPTGSAVVGDIISILRNNIDLSSSNASRNNHWSMDVNNIEYAQSEYYIRITVRDVPGVLGRISTIFGDNNVSLSTVIQKGNSKDFVPLVFITHKTSEGDMRKAIKAIEGLQSVLRIENIIRVENSAI